MIALLPRSWYYESLNASQRQRANERKERPHRGSVLKQHRCMYKRKAVAVWTTPTRSMERGRNTTLRPLLLAMYLFPDRCARKILSWLSSTSTSCMARRNPLALLWTGQVEESHHVRLSEATRQRKHEKRVLPTVSVASPADNIPECGNT